jgi:hypothetical protein
LQVAVVEAQSERLDHELLGAGMHLARDARADAEPLCNVDRALRVTSSRCAWRWMKLSTGGTPGTLWMR